MDIAPLSALLLAMPASLIPAQGRAPAAIRAAGPQATAQLRARPVFSPRGDLVALPGDDGIVRVWQPGGDRITVLGGHMGALTSVAFTPRGDRVLTASVDRTARLFGLGGKTIAVYAGHRGAVLAAAFSAKGDRVVTASADKTAKIWSLDGDEIATLTGHADAVLEALFSIDGEWILTVSADGTARVYDRAGKPRGVLRVAGGAAFPGAGDRIATSSADGTVRLWKLAAEPAKEFGLRATGEIERAVFVPDGARMVTTFRNGATATFEPAGRALAVMRGDASRISSVAFSPDGKRIATSDGAGEPRVMLMDERLRWTGRGAGEVVDVVHSPDGARFLMVGRGGTVRVFDASSGRLEQQVRARAAAIGRDRRLR